MTSSEPQKKKEENETYRERTFMQRDNKTLPANGESGGLRWDEVKKSRKSDAAELPHHKVPPPPWTLLAPLQALRTSEPRPKPEHA